ncbi:MAG TPA: hypothetical protein PKI49_02510 [Pseudomonadota bacterium]|jgi:hypothetical protein|nr:hypothetical protein [Pseudomonadota bacterium]HND10340.1 hypothetical protein [Pseudomonadota bacterium]HNF96307.1 hypothetical protein [Pseudomonadota bacterium]HNI60301.1 hypothetical protein [Pseudomonadota bacterium]HNK45893.1 hypothetical protein [Pseudomonadota bacterium]
MAQTEINSAAADSFDDFLQAAIKDYADRGWQRPNFVALLIASGQSASLAKNALSTGDGLKTVALGTVGVMALRVILTRVLAGPIGLILTGVSVAGLVAFFVRHQREIVSKTARFRELIERTKASFDESQTGYRQNRMDARERNLMIDGLLKRFLRECDEI